MKITKRQLRRIIKEEKAKVLAEQKVRHIVRRTLLEQAEELYPGLWLNLQSGKDERLQERELAARGGFILTDYYHEVTFGRGLNIEAVDELPKIFKNDFEASQPAAGKPVRVSDALAELDPSDPVYQLIDKAAAKKAKKKGGKVKLNDLTGWERLRDHPQWAEGMSDVLAVVKKNGGRGISAYMDEETASDRNDLVQLENGFKETKRVNHETAMDSGTIIIGTVGSQKVAVWDVMGYQTWMY